VPPDYRPPTHLYFESLTTLPQCDLNDLRKVPAFEGRDVADSFGLPFFESSARNRVNVEEAFFELVRVLFLTSDMFIAVRR
jgi:hypothetical protein